MPKWKGGKIVGPSEGDGQVDPEYKYDPEALTEAERCVYRLMAVTFDPEQDYSIEYKRHLFAVWLVEHGRLDGEVVPVDPAELYIEPPPDSAEVDSYNHYSTNP